MSDEKGIKAISVPTVNTKAFSSDIEVVDEVINGLKVAGACIIQGLYSDGTIENLDQEIKPYLSESGNTTCKLVKRLYCRR